MLVMLTIRFLRFVLTRFPRMLQRRPRLYVLTDLRNRGQSGSSRSVHAFIYIPNFIRVIFRGVQSVPDSSHVPIAVSVRVWGEGRVVSCCQAPCCSHKSTPKEV